MNFRDKMPGDSISNFKLFPSDDELSPSSQPSAKDKDPPYDPRFNRPNWIRNICVCQIKTWHSDPDLNSDWIGNSTPGFKFLILDLSRGHPQKISLDPQNWS